MLKFYYAPLSVNARRVWIALLEKQIPFEAIALKLDGDQFQPDFTAINPLQRVPVLIDEDLRIVESFAILDYLETKFPTPALMPTDAAAIAKIRMIQMVCINELQPATIPLMKQMLQMEIPGDRVVAAQQRITTTLQFLEALTDNSPYFVGENFTLADIVAGTLVPSVDMFGMPLTPYPNLHRLINQLAERPSWQTTAPSPETIQAAIGNIKTILATR